MHTFDYWIILIHVFFCCLGLLLPVTLVACYWSEHNSKLLRNETNKEKTQYPLWYCIVSGQIQCTSNILKPMITFAPRLTNCMVTTYFVKYRVSGHLNLSGFIYIQLSIQWVFSGSKYFCNL